MQNVGCEVITSWECYQEYTIVSKDSLSPISSIFYGNRLYWTVCILVTYRRHSWADNEHIPYILSKTIKIRSLVGCYDGLCHTIAFSQFCTGFIVGLCDYADPFGRSGNEVSRLESVCLLREQPGAVRGSGWKTDAKSGQWSPDQASKRYTTTSSMRQQTGKVTAQLKLETLNDNPYNNLLTRWRISFF